MSNRKAQKIKKITNVNQEIEPEGDECVFYLTYNEEMTQIMLTISSARAMTPEEYMLALADFVNDAHLNPDKLFVEDAVPDEGLH